jgi:hypothetical protein
VRVGGADVMVFKRRSAVHRFWGLKDEIQKSSRAEEGLRGSFRGLELNETLVWWCPASDSRTSFPPS